MIKAIQRPTLVVVGSGMAGEPFPFHAKVQHG